MAPEHVSLHGFPRKRDHTFTTSKIQLDTKGPFDFILAVQPSVDTSIAKTAEIRQKKWEKSGVQSPELPGVIGVSRIKLYQFGNITLSTTIAETLVKQELPVK